MSEQEATSTEFEEPEEKKQQAPVPKPGSISDKFNANFYARTRTGIYMILGFIIFLAAGQFYSACLVMFLNFLIFHQINNLKRNEEKQINIPMTKYINWYLFTIVNYYCFGNFISKKMPILGFWYPLVGKILLYHNFICFMGLIIGFVGFVLSLKQGYLKYQFRLFGWIVIATIIVCIQAWSMIHNVYAGMIWFIQSTLLIICNDIFAYFFGYFFGRTPLIALSPKKTWEGFIGGAVTTFFFSLLLTSALLEVPGALCPMIEPTIIPFQYPSCSGSQLLATVHIPYFPFSVSIIQAHMLVLSLFACTLGPFGGFFASGLKRSIKIKDFANLIPGHGGVSDRMDCQLIMGSFTYFYIQSIVLISSNITYWLYLLDDNQKMTLFNELKVLLGDNAK